MLSYRGSRVLSVARGRPAQKLAISMDSELADSVRAMAAADGVSVSAWISAASRDALQIRDGLAAVAEWEAEHGAFNEAELSMARERVAAETTPSGHRAAR